MILALFLPGSVYFFLSKIHKDLSTIQSMRYIMEYLLIKGVMMNIGELCNRETIIVQKDENIVNMRDCCKFFNNSLSMTLKIQRGY
jgi:hypothetical protein